MRFVNLDRLEPPAGWEDRAAAAKTAAAEAQSDAERKAIIKAKADIWRDLKPSLEKLSNKKCWYCEAIQERSDKHVDHFRPKNQVDEDACGDHPGYWWLAFDWNNFRYSCAFCNSPHRDAETGASEGKGARFPLFDEMKRCYNESDSLADEQPALLDPTVPGEPDLIWFDEDGMSRPLHSVDAAEWPHRRATESIQIYHLNDEDIRQARLAVCNECKRTVADADESWRAYRAGSPVGQDRFTEAIRRLTERLQRDVEYSATARATLMGLRSANRPWLDVTLAAA